MSGASAASPILADLLVADFDYDLPHELIAQSPLERRDASRLLVLDRRGGRITHSAVDRLGEWLAPGDLIVANNVALEGAGFDSDTNVVTLIDRTDRAESLPMLPKPEVAGRILDRIHFLLKEYSKISGRKSTVPGRG